MHIPLTKIKATHIILISTVSPGKFRLFKTTRIDADTLTWTRLFSDIFTCVACSWETRHKDCVPALSVAWLWVQNELIPQSTYWKRLGHISAKSLCLSILALSLNCLLDCFIILLLMITLEIFQKVLKPPYCLVYCQQNQNNKWLIVSHKLYYVFNCEFRKLPLKFF